jgi:hypothetical protein
MAVLGRKKQLRGRTTTFSKLRGIAVGIARSRGLEMIAQKRRVSSPRGARIRLIA